MKKSRARPRRHAPRPLELSAGAQPGDVRLTAFANARVFIENHSGIIEFDDAHVRVAARRMALTVSGEGLIIDACEARSIVIRGHIARVEWESRGGAHE